MIKTIKRYLKSSPFLYFNLNILNPNFRCLRARKSYDLVLEGFPRSANSFAAYTIFYSQKSGFKMGHHLHAPAHLRYAVKNRIPCLVIIREPLGAVSSLIIRNKCDPKNALLDYISFMKVSLALSDSIVFANFNDIISGKIGVKVMEINQRFDVALAIPENTPNERIWVEENIKNWNKVNEAGDQNMLAMPSETKKNRRDEAVEQLKRNAEIVEEAQELYKALSQLV